MERNIATGADKVLAASAEVDADNVLIHPPGHIVQAVALTPGRRHCTDGRYLGHWLHDLKNGNEVERGTARLIVTHFREAAVPGLAEILQSGDATAREDAAAAVASMTRGTDLTPALPAFTSALGEAVGVVRANAAMVLGKAAERGLLGD